ncbi:MAG: hypothetical protein K1X83_09060 [Oligoflexia bacterium]|nr:hypothetical protein [Oligoflexia bacterium]
MIIKRVIHSENGEGALLATATIGLLLLLMTLAFHAVTFYAQYTPLKGLATDSALHAGTFLPDPTRACEAAFDSVELYRNDFRKSGEIRYPELTAKVTITSYSTPPNPPDLGPDPDAAPGSAPLVTPTSTVANARAECATLKDSLVPPIDSLQVSVRAAFDFNLMNVFSLASEEGSLFHVAARSTVRLEPTDVMLVVENSNSVVTPMETEEPKVFATDADARAWATAIPDGYPFAVGSGPGSWKDSYLGWQNSETEPQYKFRPDDAPVAILNKALLRTRQCFGGRHLHIKEAAVRLYDLLSSSASFRVGAVHTLSPSGEFNFPTIDIGTSSFASAYVPRPVSELNEFQRGVAPAGDGLREKGLSHSAPMPAYGYAEYPESRCAAITKPGQDPKYYFPMPPHPLFDELPILAAADPSKMVGTSSASPSANPLDALKFNPDASFLPRNLLWIASAGAGGVSGILDRRFNYTPMQFAILRARDTLVRAKARADLVPVRKRVVLVLTDGFERPGIDFNPLDVGTAASYTRVAQDVLDSGATAGAGTVEHYKLPPLNAEGNAIQREEPFVSNYCLSAAQDHLPNQNLIFEDTKVDVSNSEEGPSPGFKLGVLYYNEEIPPTNTALAPGGPIPGHDPRSPEVDAFRRACNTPWSNSRGRFLIEAAGRRYGEDLPRLVARALFNVQIVE